MAQYKKKKKLKSKYTELSSAIIIYINEYASVCVEIRENTYVVKNAKDVRDSSNLKHLKIKMLWILFSQYAM